MTGDTGPEAEAEMMDAAERRRLVALIREAANPMLPVPPELPPGWSEEAARPERGNGQIRAVLFDVYGTLFCSAAGDISMGAESAGPGGAALDTLAGQYGLTGEGLRSFFRAQVAALHRARSPETRWPEVRVERIWAGFLREQDAVPPGDSPEAAGRELALRYELAVNPVYPMPGTAETIAALGASGRKLGIISNAQFFTPLLFEAFFGALPEKLGFDPELLIWSFALGEAKPSPRLFGAAVRRLTERGISPAETAFVGNDMLSDMYGAMEAGFQGILFAGDNRSLRLREDDPRVRDLRPARVILSLGETMTGM